MDTRPPTQPGEPTPYKKWIMDSITTVIYILNSIAETLKAILSKTARQRLKIDGSEILMIEDIALGMSKSPRTFRKFRAEGKLDYYISNDGRTVFMTQEQFEQYIKRNFQKVEANQ